MPLDVEVSHGQTWLEAMTSGTIWRAELLRAHVHTWTNLQIRTNLKHEQLHTLFLGLAAAFALTVGNKQPHHLGFLAEGASVTQRTTRLKKSSVPLLHPWNGARPKDRCPVLPGPLHCPRASNYVTADRQAVNLGCTVPTSAMRPFLKKTPSA